MAVIKIISDSKESIRAGADVIHLPGSKEPELVVNIYAGDDTVIINVDSVDEIESLGDRLVGIAEELRGEV